MKSYFKLLRYLLPYQSLILLFGIFSVITVVFSLVSLVLLAPFLELLFDRTELVLEEPNFELSKDYLIRQFYYLLSNQIITSGKTAALAFFCVVVSITFLLKNLFRYLALYVLAPLRNKLILTLRDELYQKMIKLPISFFESRQKGDLITHFTSDLAEIEYSIMNTLETAIQSPLNIALFLMAMLSISPQLTVFVFAMILVMALIIGRIGKSLKKESKNAKSMLGALASIIDETVSGIKILQAYMAQDWIYNKFKIENHNLYRQYNRMYRKRDLSSPLTEFLAIVVICIVLWYGGNLVLSGQQLSPSNFIAFMVIFSQLIPPAKSFSSAWYEIKKGMASYDRIESILTSPEAHQAVSDAKEAKYEHSIKFEQVSFGYPNTETLAIDSFSYEFKKGKKYALVGASGAGKSTIFEMLLRYRQPQSGKITIDGVDISEYSIGSYLHLFGIVTQEPILFNYNVSENIEMGANNPQKLEESLRKANAWHFVTQGIGLNSEPIGERGSKLSGGEKQRISIARVAYRNPKIVLLDEATSALDSQSELEVQQGLENLLKDKTSLIIAHRLSTIQSCDEILVMNQGKIIEVGNHQSLMNKGGVYAQMVSMQQI